MKVFKYSALLALVISHNFYAVRNVIITNTTRAKIMMETRYRTSFDYNMPEELRAGQQRLYSFDMFAGEFDRPNQATFAELRIAYFNQTRDAYSEFYPINFKKLKEVIRNCQNWDVIVDILERQENSNENEAPTRIYCSHVQAKPSAQIAVSVFKDKEALQKLGVQESATALQVLGLPSGASKNQINTAWKKLTLKWHPDKGNDENKIKHRVSQILQDARAQALQEAQQ